MFNTSPPWKINYICCTPVLDPAALGNCPVYILYLLVTMSMVFKFMQAEWNVFLRRSREVVKFERLWCCGLCSSCCLFKLWMLTGRQVAVWRKRACCWLISSPASDEPKKASSGLQQRFPGDISVIHFRDVQIDLPSSRTTSGRKLISKFCCAGCADPSSGAEP